MMTRAQATEAILQAKAEKQLTFTQIAEAVGRHVVWVTAALHGQATMSADEAQKAAKALGLGPDVAASLMEFATKGEASPTIPKEPLAYRFQEIIYVYGRTMKEIIEEKFGAGIMSAIDFTLDIEKVPDPKGDRVKITMNGKFLPYKRW